MLRLRVVVVLCVVAVATVAIAQEPGRNIFVYKETGVDSMGLFKHTGGPDWIENGPLGERYQFREVTRNKEFVEIFDKSREVEVRIYAKKYMWKHPKDTKGKWEGKLEGHWLK